MPRAIEWTPELIDSICTRIAQGESVAKISKDKSMPCESSIWVYAAKNKEFQSAITRAMEIRTEREMEALVELADTADEKNANAVKLKVWTRMWLAGKRKPKKYGDKLALGGDEDNPVVIRRVIAR